MTPQERYAAGKPVAFNPGSFKGGKCPVDPADTVTVRLANNREITGPAGQMGWELDYTPDGWAIVSYRKAS